MEEPLLDISAQFGADGLDKKVKSYLFPVVSGLISSNLDVAVIHVELEMYLS